MEWAKSTHATLSLNRIEPMLGYSYICLKILQCDKKIILIKLDLTEYDNTSNEIIMKKTVTICALIREVG